MTEFHCPLDSLKKSDLCCGCFGLNVLSRGYLWEIPTSNEKKEGCFKSEKSLIASRCLGSDNTGTKPERYRSVQVARVPYDLQEMITGRSEATCCPAAKPSCEEKQH